MNYRQDPEVTADIRAREDSEHDRDRTGEYTFGDPRILEHWPCRTGCGAMVGVTDATIFAFRVANDRLAARGERPISKAKVMWCPDCKRRDDELAQMERSKR